MVAYFTSCLVKRSAPIERLKVLLVRDHVFLHGFDVKVARSTFGAGFEGKGDDLGRALSGRVDAKSSRRDLATHRDGIVFHFRDLKYDGCGIARTRGLEPARA